MMTFAAAVKAIIVRIMRRESTLIMLKLARLRDCHAIYERAPNILRKLCNLNSVHIPFIGDASDFTSTKYLI